MMARWALPEDLAMVNAWQRARGLPTVARELLSPYGFVVSGVAAVWLYITDGRALALLEHLVSNPDVPQRHRDAGVDEVVRAAVAYARAHDVRAIVAVTSMPAVVERAKRHGFRVERENATLLVAELGGA